MSEEIGEISWLGVTQVGQADYLSAKFHVERCPRDGQVFQSGKFTVEVEFPPLSVSVLGNGLTNEESKVRAGRVGSRVDVEMLSGSFGCLCLYDLGPE